MQGRRTGSSAASRSSTPTSTNESEKKSPAPTANQIKIQKKLDDLTKKHRLAKLSLINSMVDYVNLSAIFFFYGFPFLLPMIRILYVVSFVCRILDLYANWARANIERDEAENRKMYNIIHAIVVSVAALISGFTSIASFAGATRAAMAGLASNLAWMALYNFASGFYNFGATAVLPQIEKNEQELKANEKKTLELQAQHSSRMLAHFIATAGILIFAPTGILVIFGGVTSLWPIGAFGGLAVAGYFANRYRLENKDYYVEQTNLKFDYIHENEPPPAQETTTTLHRSLKLVKRSSLRTSSSDSLPRFARDDDTETKSRRTLSAQPSRSPSPRP